MRNQSLVFVAVAVLLWFLGVMSVEAETFYPLPLADAPDHNTADGVCDSDPSPAVVTCTLRAAVMQATALPGLDTIQLAAGVYALTLTGSDDAGGDLNVEDDLRILGVAGSIIDGGGIDRIFKTYDADLEIERLTLRNGDAATGGGAILANRSLTLRDVEITECVAGSSGGALYDYGQQTVPRWFVLERCWIHANQATNGGGVRVGNNCDLVVIDSTISFNTAQAADGGGINNDGRLYLNNSTVAGNAAKRDGGGILSYGRVKISSSTVIGNYCDLDADGDGDGCGIKIVGAVVEVRNTIIAGNLNWNISTPITEPDDCFGSFTSAGFNLIGFPGSSCTGFSAGTADLVGAPFLDAQLAGLDDNGGFGPTSMPEPGSPVIDAGNPAGCVGDVDGDWNSSPTLLTTEQRGYPRILDDDGDGVARCTIGAIEMAIFADGFESGDTGVW